MFGGVFTPSILTILGVIMYLRLPWIVGNSGLYLAIGIILAAHIISVTTGLSVSSIATDKRVEAGGAYYIVSRSMGLAMGGTLGLALFVGLSFSISLYIIGFSESFLDYFEMTKDITNIRICGTIVIVLLTIITFVSTSLALQTQYFILVAIVASLVSIAFGSSDFIPEAPHLLAPVDGESATVLFGIFFPAVTGFTAGVNMSGDLKDPRRSIPVGTIVAIAVGLLVYVGLATFLAYRIDPHQLRTNDVVLLEFAWSPRAVVAGIWGATISSALGSILGAPRILQALSLDQVTPKIFGVGHGKTNEPRYALILACLIGEAGILIGELDAIARIVSVFFIATYGFLNLSASFEMIASPDFRPDFKIPRWVPVLGAITCAVLMIWLDLVAMIGALLVMGALFLFLKRRELELETGDAWLGVWSSVVRFGLDRLTTESLHQRNWRPNILLFTQDDAATRLPLMRFGHSLVRHRGVLTELRVHRGGEAMGAHELAPEDEAESETPQEIIDQQGFFSRGLAMRDGDDLYDVMGAVCRFHGISGLLPNTVMVDWHDHATRAEPFSEFLELVHSLDCNLMCLSHYERDVDHRTPRVDLWLSADTGSLALNLALVRFITSADEWRRATLHFFVLCDDDALTDGLHRMVVEQLREARVEGEVKVVKNAVEARSHDDWIVQLSASADLVVIGIRHRDVTTEYIRDLDALSARLNTVLLVRASSSFTSGFDLVSKALTRDPTQELAGAVQLPPLVLPETPDLAVQARLFQKAHMKLGRAFSDRSLRGAFTGTSALIDELHDEVETSYRQLSTAVRSTSKWRARRTFRRSPETLLKRVEQALLGFERQDLLRQQAAIERAVEDLLEGCKTLEAEIPSRLSVTRIHDDFVVGDDDPAHLRRFKDHRRWLAKLRRSPISYSVGARRLGGYYLHYRTNLQALESLRSAAGLGLTAIQDLGRFSNVLKESLSTLWRSLESGALDSDAVDRERDRLLVVLRRQQEAHAEAAERVVHELLLAFRTIEQDYADDLDRLNPRRFIRKERRIPREARDQREDLQEAHVRWAEALGIFARRAAVVPQIGLVQHRVVAAVDRACESVSAAIAGGVSRDYTLLVESTQSFRDALASEQLTHSLPVVSMDESFDASQVVDVLHKELRQATSHTSTELRVPLDASIQLIETDPLGEVEVAEVDLRQHLQFLMDADLIAPTREILAEVPRAAQKATSVAEDVVRLITFNITDLDTNSESAANEAREFLGPVVDNGLTRLRVEQEVLLALSETLNARVRERLEHVIDVTNSFAIMGSAEVFAARKYGASERFSGLNRVTDWVSTEANQALVSLAYHRSSGELLARRMGAVDGPVATAVDDVLAVVDRLTPSAEVSESLPFYYRQLFLAQSAVHSAFWVGRTTELEELRRAVSRYDGGARGGLVITGEPGSGKTALREVAIEHFLAGRTVVRLTPPKGGSCELGDFTQALSQELGLKGSLDELVESLPEDSVLVIQDAELWWERSAEGLAVIDAIAELIEQHGDRCLIVVEIGLAAYRFISRHTPIADQALTVVECGPVDARTLNHIITLRHRSTGLQFETDSGTEEELSEWSKAQLFTAHFRHSGGLIGPALGSWIAHVEGVEDGKLRVGRPVALDVSALGAVRMELTAVLIQLALHRQLRLSRLVVLCGERETVLRRHLASLRRMGLVRARKREVYELSSSARSVVTLDLRQRGLLP